MHVALGSQVFSLISSSKMSAALKILACGRCEILPANQNGGAEFIQGRAEDCDSRNAGSATLYTYGIEENSIVYSLVY